MISYGRILATTATSLALAGGLLIGAAPASTASVDTAVSAVVAGPKPRPTDRNDPRSREDPRCMRAQEALAGAKAKVRKKRAKLKDAPRAKKPRARKQLKNAKAQRERMVSLVGRFCR